MPPTLSGETFEHTISRSQPSSAIRSNLRSARANTRSRFSPVMPSKSRNGWKVMISSPRSAQRWRTSAGVPLNDSRSFSKISTPLKPAAAIASSFSSRLPLSDTVAIDIFTGCVSSWSFDDALLRRSDLAPAYRQFPSRCAISARPEPTWQCSRVGFRNCDLKSASRTAGAAGSCAVPATTAACARAWCGRHHRRHLSHREWARNGR